MKVTRQVFFLVCLATFALRASGGKDDDYENLPYEFGFTIDGQQHRHEKKDVNGIIQGEFGFITADGIYHVTVYATDENGNFRILSMRNVRVSPPLDGSGTPEQKQQQLQPYKSQPSPPPQVKPQAQASTPAPVTTPKFNGFTTQSTIKPACAACGYVTTAATPSGQPKKFEFQTPAFRERQGAGINPSVSSPGALSPAPGSGATSGPASSNYQQGVGGNQQQQSQAPLSVNVPLAQNQSPYAPVQNVATSYQQGNQPSQENQPPQYSPNQNQVDYGDIGGQAPFPGASPQQQGVAGVPPSPAGQEPALNQGYPSSPAQTPSARLSQVQVSDGVIRIPGNPDIPIKDKYPNMQDGLPQGIEEKDITDLLYKFNYTVGFHGHYEKGYKNGAKVGGYFVNGRDGISRVVTYVADENGYQPKVKLINLGLDSPDTPKEGTEKSFGLKNFEFVWYPVS